MKDYGTLVGMIAGLCTTFAFLPQAIQVMRTRKTEDISLPMYAALETGVALWIVYGVMEGLIPVIIYNTITFVLAGSIMIMKLRFG